jgi:thiol-disulfide isomerase/thioredoxin
MLVNNLSRQLRVMMLGAAFALSAHAAHAAQTGQPAPDFSLPGLKGDVTLSQLKGKVVYLDFWASWCVPCRKTFPWMNEMTKKYGKDGFEVVAINLDKKREDADGFLAKIPAEFTVALDQQGAAAKLYELQGMPSSFIIDRSGVVQVAHKGFKDGQQDELEAQIKKAVSAN